MKKRWIIWTVLALLLTSCGGKQAETPAPSSTPPPTATHEATPTPGPTATLAPTVTRRPTVTLIPSPKPATPTVTRVATAVPSAATAVATSAPATTGDIDALIQALVEGDDETRRAAVEQLAAMGSQAAEAIPALIQALADQSPEVRQAVAEALGTIGLQISDVVPALAQALADQNIAVREAVAEALRIIGPQAMEAVPALIEALADQSPEVRQVVAEALKAITGQDFGLDAERWRQWWEGQQSAGPLDFPEPTQLDGWEPVQDGYQATIVVHISGGAPPFTVHHDMDTFATWEREYALVFVTKGCPIVRTITVESADGQRVAHDYFIRPPWCD